LGSFAHFPGFGTVAGAQLSDFKFRLGSCSRPNGQLGFGGQSIVVERIAIDAA
jgi:hypothetical protein